MSVIDIIKQKEIIYVYSTPTYLKNKWYKIGMTTQESAELRIAQQDSTSNPEKLEKLYKLDISELGISSYDVEQKIHGYYDRLGKRVRDHREWFFVDGGINEIKSVIESILDNKDVHKSEIKLKPHQVEANDKINQCFKDDKLCLLAHKPRSGKTFTTLYNIKQNNYTNVLILTSYPVLNFQWEETIDNSKGFSDTNVIVGSTQKLILKEKNIVLLSLQDVKGGHEVFEKQKFDSIKDIEWDLVVIDEVHYGVETFKTEDFLSKINYKRLLGLSATPTKNLLCGRFSPNQIHSYTLVEESILKKKYPELYPYADINWYLWTLIESERTYLKYFSDEEQIKFDKLFRIEDGQFYYKNDISYIFKKLIGDREVCKGDKLGTLYPFKNNSEFCSVQSILLFVPNIAAQNKLKELLEDMPSFSSDFNIHITNSEENTSKQLMNKIRRDFKSTAEKRSLIIAVDQLTTGITLDDCDMVVMMNDWMSIDKYIQASFRCQSPREGKIKCFVLDLNPARSFELLWEYNNVISRNNCKSVGDNLRDWLECVNIFNRVEGGFKQIDFESFNQEYNSIVSEKPRFNYSSVIFSDKLKEAEKALFFIGLKGTLSSSDTDLDEDGVTKGKSKKGEKNSKGSNKEVEDISPEKLMEIAKALVDKTMLLSIFTGFKYSNVDECFIDLISDNSMVRGLKVLKRDMYLETLLLGMNDIDKVSLNVIKHIYDTIYNKDIINKKLFLFNNKVNSIYNSIRENPNCIDVMLKNQLDLIESYLRPSATEKKLLAEVFTSLKLVNEMLDTLPKEVWSNPNLKWLDPANGVGNFPAIVVKRLMEGLKVWQPDSELRLKHILENMIYVCDISSKNMFIYLHMFDPENKYNMKYYLGSYLEEDFNNHMKSNWNIDRFDIIIGNPPYQGVNKGNGSNLYEKFHSKSVEILSDDGYLIFLTPLNWISPNGNLESEFLKYNLIYVNINECSKYFPGVGSEFSFYLIKKSSDYTTTLIKTTDDKFSFDLRKFSFLPKFININTLSIHTKFFNCDLDSLNVERDQSYTQYSSKMKGNLSTIEDEYFCYKMYNTSSKNGIKFSKIKHPLVGTSKIIMSRSGYLNPIFDESGEYGVLELAYFIKVESKIEGDYILDLLNSKLYKYITTTYKYSGFNSHNILKKLKYPKLLNIKDKSLDEKIFEYFNITEEEVKIIELTIKN